MRNVLPQYLVPRLPRGPAVGTAWTRPPWTSVTALTLDCHMGERPAHFPLVQARLACDETALHGIFRVRDRYVRAVARRHQDAVCRDSCVEFFFVPGTNIARGYFNLEINCGGIKLFHFQREPRKNPVPVAAADLATVAVAHSLPRRVEPELRRTVLWTVSFRLPFRILGNYCPATPPRTGTVWRANFYKCADKTSHPHWLTWAPVHRPQPDFHVPEDFGTLVFA
jgi:hypothetical protein